MSELTDSLKNAFTQSTIVDDQKIAVKAEDVQQSSGIDFSKHYFEAKVGSTYLIKFLPNPGGNPIEHRSVYKDLPDPERKGKTFHYVSSGNAKTCKVLELFFELFALKKNGDVKAEKKIDKYLGKSNQGCCKIQILQSPVAEEVGMIRMMTFATFGPNATVSNLIDSKLNPSEAKIKAGEEREDIFNIFDSPVLSLECVEGIYPGKNGAPAVKGRDFTKSSWLKKNRGAIGSITDKDGNVKTREFKKEDLVNGEVVGDALPYFEAFVEQVCNPDYDIRNFFSYKEINDPKNLKETNDYLISVQKKVDEIIPIIRDKDLSEIAAYGKVDNSDSTKKPDNAKNMMAESLPDELQGSIMDESKHQTSTTKTDSTKNESITKTDPPKEIDEADAILNS